MPTTIQSYVRFALTIGKHRENRKNRPCTDKLAGCKQKANKIRGFSRLSVDGATAFLRALPPSEPVKGLAGPLQESVDNFFSAGGADTKKNGGQRMSGLHEALTERDCRRQEQPLVDPQVSHLRQVPFRTMVKLPHSEQLSPS